MTNPVLLVSNFDGSLDATTPSGATTWTVDAGTEEYTTGPPAQLELDAADGDLISITPTGHISASSGAMAFWLTRLVDTGSTEVILECGDSLEDWLRVLVISDHIEISWSQGGSLPQFVASDVTVAVDVPTFVYLQWDAITQGVRVGSEALSVGVRDLSGGTWGDDLRFEAASGAKYAIGPFLTASRLLTPTEVGFLAGTRTWLLTTIESTTATSTVPGTGDAHTVWFDLAKADIDNAQSTQLGDYFHGTNAGIDLNHDRDIKTQAVLPIQDPSLLEPYRDYVAVWLNREWDDGRESQRDQLGLFGIRVPPGTRTVERADAIYTGHDLTALVARYAFTDAYNIAAASNYVTAVTDILALAGITRTLIEPTTQTTAAVISFPAGTTYLKACNTLLNAIGYYNLAAMPDGRLFSTPTRALQYVEPYRVITDDDLMRPVDVQPLDTTVANIIIVVKDNPNAAPLIAVRTNDATDSPTSTVNIGPIARLETRGDLADQAAVDALADRLISEARSFYFTVKLSVLPDPRVLIPHQTVELNLTGKLEPLNGLYWMRTARLPLNTKATEIECNRVTDNYLGLLV